MNNRRQGRTRGVRAFRCRTAPAEAGAVRQRTAPTAGRSAGARPAGAAPPAGSGLRQVGGQGDKPGAIPQRWTADVFGAQQRIARVVRTASRASRLPPLPAKERARNRYGMRSMKGCRPVLHASRPGFSANREWFIKAVA